MSGDYLEYIKHDKTPVISFTADRVVVEDSSGRVVYDTNNPKMPGFVFGQDFTLYQERINNDND